jgi:hypothetical protein
MNRSELESTLTLLNAEIAAWRKESDKHSVCEINCLRRVIDLQDEAWSIEDTLKALDVADLIFRRAA